IWLRMSMGNKKNSILFRALSEFKTGSPYPCESEDETGPSRMAAMRDAFSMPFSVGLPVLVQE
ncbi:MAG: hypothetical protein ACXWWW_10575, partial [Candidatus Deferrimicrobiaceae bacterium]